MCKKPGPKLLVISHDDRFQAFIDGNILIPAGTRGCPTHLLENGHLKTECFIIVSTSEKSFSNRTSIVNLLTHMREICINNQNKIDFDNIDNRDCKNLTGLLLDQFEDTCSFILINIKSTPSRTPKTSVGLFLIIIWYLSGARDRTAFGVPDWSTYLSNANNLPETIDTSDSETESIGSVIEE